VFESVIPTLLDLVIDGKKLAAHIGVNPIALDKNDEWLYFGPMHSSKLYRARTTSLRDPSVPPPAEFYAERPITDGISIDNDGNIYLGDLANNAIGVIEATGKQYRELARNWMQLSWVDAFCFAPDGYYYVVANQLHKSAALNGKDETKPPYKILRFRPLAPGHVGR